MKLYIYAMESALTKGVNLNEEVKKERTKELREKRKKKKKTKMPKIKMVNEIIPIKNADKTHTEKWTESRAKKDISNLPNPSRILLLGPPSVGKSTLIKNLIIHQDPPFEEVYLVHEDAEYTNEWLDLEPTECFSEIPDLEFWERDEGKFKKRAIILDDLEYVVPINRD